MLYYISPLSNPNCNQPSDENLYLSLDGDLEMGRGGRGGKLFRTFYFIVSRERDAPTTFITGN